MRVYILIVSLVLILGSSCSKKREYIPDDDLREIILESVVADMYLRTIGTHNIKNDTVSIFLPILDDYGYTYDDMDYTIERMMSRKSNVFGQLMDKVVADVKELRERYEYISSLGRNWRKKVTNEVIDTLFFSPDSIRIRGKEDLKMLNYRLPLTGAKEYLISFNYQILPQDSNSSRYVVYNYSDSLSGEEYAGSNLWLSKSQKMTKFSRTISVRGGRKRNMIDIRILSYSSNKDYLSDYGLKSMDIYIDSVTIMSRPDYEIASDRLFNEIYPSSDVLEEILNYGVDNGEYVVPYDTITGKRKPYPMDSVRYDRSLKEIRILPTPQSKTKPKVSQKSADILSIHAKNRRDSIQKARREANKKNMNNR